MKIKRGYSYITLNLKKESADSHSNEILEILGKGGKILSAVADGQGAIHYILTYEEQV